MFHCKSRRLEFISLFFLYLLFMCVFSELYMWHQVYSLISVSLWKEIKAYFIVKVDYNNIMLRFPLTLFFCVFNQVFVCHSMYISIRVIFIPIPHRIAKLRIHSHKNQHHYGPRIKMLFIRLAVRVNLGIYIILSAWYII